MVFCALSPHGGLGLQSGGSDSDRRPLLYKSNNHCCQNPRQDSFISALPLSYHRICGCRISRRAWCRFACPTAYSFISTRICRAYPTRWLHQPALRALCVPSANLAVPSFSYAFASFTSERLTLRQEKAGPSPLAATDPAHISITDQYTIHINLSSPGQTNFLYTCHDRTGHISMAKYRPPPRLPDPLRKVSLYSSLNLPYGFASNFLVILLSVPFLILPNGGVL